VEFFENVQSDFGLVCLFVFELEVVHQKDPYFGQLLLNARSPAVARIANRTGCQ